MAQERPVKEKKKGKIGIKMPGQAKPVKMSEDELREAHRKTKEWEKIEEGVTYTVPVYHFLKQAANTKKKPAANSQKIVNTRGRSEVKLTEKKDLMIEAGMTLPEAENELMKDKEVYEPYRQAWADKAEIDLVNAINNMHNGGIMVSSVQVKKVKSILQDLGFKFKFAQKDGEVDGVYIYPDGDILKVKLFKVKRPNGFTWEAMPWPPDTPLVVKGWEQLGYDFTLFTEIFADFSPAQIQFEAVLVFPHTPRAQLSRVMQGEEGGECSLCLPGVLGQEDIQDSALLRQRLHIAPATAPVTELGRELLLTAATRLFGLNSLLHLDRRMLEQVGPAERERREQIL